MGKKAKLIVPDIEDRRVRIAIVDEHRCKPSKCNQECKRYCPVNAQGKFCVDATKQSQTATIAEGLCNGCGICVKRCPFNAIRVINLPSNLTKDTTHRHGPNGFKLHRLPLPRVDRVLGLLGTNGIGKSTALSILAGKLKPNLGQHQGPPDWKNIVNHFRGSELQTYFKRLLEDNLKVICKPQYVERFATFEKIAENTRVGEFLAQKDEKNMSSTIKELDLAHLLDREVRQLSGGELQRLAIATLCVQKADVYMVDEPSAYLDIRQRLRAAQAIRAALGDTSYIVVVEHDLAVLDYVSDLVCCLWGSSGAYGAVTAPFGASEGINHFLDGFIPTENLRTREEPLTFRTAKDHEEAVVERLHFTSYPHMTKILTQDERRVDPVLNNKALTYSEMSTKHNSDQGLNEDELKEHWSKLKKVDSHATGDSGSEGFRLDIDSGNFADSEIIVMLGENGTGKTTFIKMLAGKLGNQEFEKLSISWKPQMVVPKYSGTVRQLLLEKINTSFLDPQFQSDVVRPMHVDKIEDLEVLNLSGGQLQSVALVLALGKPADIYLIDEPSAYLDVEQRVAASRVLRRFILHQKKTAFVVEHDFVMATYLADRVIVFDGQPGVQCHASCPLSLAEGMNKFLAQLDITFRAGRNGRPRINKVGGVRDREQKKEGNYFFSDRSD